MKLFYDLVGGFGRRASDGGSHFHSYSNRAVSEPGSQEELQLVRKTIFVF